MILVSVYYKVDGSISDVLRTIPPFYEYSTEWSTGELTYDLDHGLGRVSFVTTDGLDSLEETEPVVIEFCNRHRDNAGMEALPCGE